MTTTRISLINDALVLNGSEPLLDENAPGAETHLSAFTRASELILSCHPWSFCTFTVPLARYAATPYTHWLYRFDLPPDMLGAPRAVFQQSDQRVPFTAFELLGDRSLLSNAETIWVQYTRAVPPAYWPGYVREVVVLLLRSELALAVREDRTLRDTLRAEAIGSSALEMQGGLLAVARGQDDMSKPSAVIGQFNNPVTSIRTGSNWWGD